MNAPVWLLVGLALGLGVTIGWLLAVWRQAASPANQALVDALKEQITQRDGSLSQLTQYHERQLAELKTAQENNLAELRESFRALCAEALDKAQRDFLPLANEAFAKFQETAKGDLSQKEQAIATLV